MHRTTLGINAVVRHLNMALESELNGDDPFNELFGAADCAIAILEAKGSISDSVFSLLIDHYCEQIESEFDFGAILGDSRWDIDNGEESEGYVYLGSVMSLYPSGKYWTCFAMGNVDSDIEAIRDMAYGEALDYVADKYHGYIESGEGDPTDLYFCMYGGA